jgi:hypothetical protein
MRFSTFLPCSGNSCGVLVLAEGVIESDTAEKFTAFVASKRQERYALPPKPSVYFDSPGGNLYGAMKLGRAIRAASFNTGLAPGYSREAPAPNYSETFVKDAKCASACALAFVGGLDRYVAEAGRYGVHQFYATSGSLGDGASQATVVAVAAYLLEMGVDRGLLDLASVVQPSSIYWLPRSELERLRIDNSAPLITPWVITAIDKGQPFISAKSFLSYGRMVTVTLSNFRNQPRVVVFLKLDRSNYGDDRLRQFPDTSPPVMTIQVDAKTITPKPAFPWMKDSRPESTYFSAAFDITRADLETIATAKQLSITDDFPPYNGDMQFSTKLSVEALGAGVGLLLRPQ